MSLRKLLMSFLLCIGVFMTNVSTCVAEEASPTYRLVIEDNAELLTEEQEAALAEIMKDISAYGNVAFVTVAENASSAESFARSFYQMQFGTDSGTVFLIDMDNELIWIHSDGAIYKVITTAYANTITDNVYRYASGEKYYECAAEAYRQIFALLEGQKIVQPMKYISNALLAMILALLINFGLVCYFTRIKKPSESEILRNIEKRFKSTKPTAVFTHESKVYDPVESGSGGSSSGGGGSRSSGGSSSSSGGGGGHRF